MRNCFNYLYRIVPPFQMSSSKTRILRWRSPTVWSRAKVIFIIYHFHCWPKSFSKVIKWNKSSQFLHIWQVKAIFKDLLFARLTWYPHNHYPFYLFPLFLFFVTTKLNRCQTAVDWCDRINCVERKNNYSRTKWRIRFTQNCIHRFSPFATVTTSKIFKMVKLATYFYPLYRSV